MIGRIGSYNGEVVGDVYLSSTGILSNGAEVLYLLADPVETEISAEEMAAFYTVHTNFPNTVILNSARTGMNAVYIADVKQYIRQQIAAISV